jgi:hypothetical protein
MNGEENEDGNPKETTFYKGLSIALFFSLSNTISNFFN